MVFGLVFTYHYRSHDYYHLPLIVPVAIGAGLLVSSLVSLVRSGRLSALTLGVAVVVLVLGGIPTTSLPYPYLEIDSGALASDRG